MPNEAETQIKIALRDLEAKYLREKETLENALRIIQQGFAAISGGSQPKKTGKAKPKQTSSMLKPKVYARDRIKRYIASFDDLFTKNDILEASKADESEEEIKVTEASVSSTLLYLTKKDYIELVEKGYGGDPNLYRLITDPEELAKRGSTSYNKKFPLKEMVLEALHKHPKGEMTRSSVFELTKELNPDRASEIKIDSVGVLFGRLSKDIPDVEISYSNGIKSTIKKDFQGEDPEQKDLEI